MTAPRYWSQVSASPLLAIQATHRQQGFQGLAQAIVIRALLSPLASGPVLVLSVRREVLEHGTLIVRDLPVRGCEPSPTHVRLTRRSDNFRPRLLSCRLVRRVINGYRLRLIVTFIQGEGLPHESEYVVQPGDHEFGQR